MNSFVVSLYEILKYNHSTLDFRLACLPASQSTEICWLWSRQHFISSPIYRSKSIKNVLRSFVCNSAVESRLYCFGFQAKGPTHLPGFFISWFFIIGNGQKAFYSQSKNDWMLQKQLQDHKSTLLAAVQCRLPEMLELFSSRIRQQITPAICINLTAF